MTDCPAERARALVGTRFRAQGRDPRFGLDCIGLILSAHRLPTDAARRDYRLRGDHRREILAGSEHLFRRVTRPKRRAGDVLLLKVASDQLHLSIMTEAGFVHADARLGQVVETPGPPRWPIVAVFRRRARARRERRG